MQDINAPLTDADRLMLTKEYGPEGVSHLIRKGRHLEKAAKIIDGSYMKLLSAATILLMADVRHNYVRYMFLAAAMLISASPDPVLTMIGTAMVSGWAGFVTVKAVSFIDELVLARRVLLDFQKFYIRQIEKED